MELTEAQYARIAPVLPVQRGNGCVSHRHVLNAFLSAAAHGCKWRGIPPRFGRWHPSYARMNRWAKKGVLNRVFASLKQRLGQLKLEVVALDRTRVKVHPAGTGARPPGPQAIGKSRGGWPSKMHLVAAAARPAMPFSVLLGQAHAAPEGRKLLRRLGGRRDKRPVLRDRAWEGNEPRQLVLKWGFKPVVPPLRTRHDPWAYDREMDKRCTAVERLFRRLKGVRRSFSRCEKLDVIFLGFVGFARIFDALR